jgi:hypothetical protein
MKILSLLLLIIGVGLSASYGSRLTPEIYEQTVAKGRAKFLMQASKAAHSEYCAQRAKLFVTTTTAGVSTVSENGTRKLADGDGCQKHVLAAPALPSEAPPAVQKQAHRAQLAKLKASELKLTDKVATLRTSWLNAKAAEIDPVIDAAALIPPEPTSRVRSWWNSAGMMFMLGLILCIIGAILGRRVAKAEALSPASNKDGTGGPVDFGELLNRLVDTAEGISSRTHALESATAEQFEAFKNEIAELQVSMFEPLIQSRGRLQALYGMSAFAEIFGPLSSAERKMNRTWAALVDQHWGESKASVAAAHADLVQAQKALASATPIK